MKDLYVGLDTSNYTTSIAIVDHSEKLIYEKRKLLEVKKGERGLRQSDAVFLHIRNLSNILEDMDESILQGKVQAVCASVRPRNTEGSYMPVFQVSKIVGQAISKFLSIPLYEVSHQEGHIMAGIWSSNFPKIDQFITLHLSGGTTECILTKNTMNGYCEEFLGGSQDLNVGQFIDRVGVSMDLRFPSGPRLEELAMEGTKGRIIIPSSVKETNISFSGPESMAQRLILKGEQRADIAIAVFHCIAKSIEKMLINVIQSTNIYDVLLVGGVASNNYIKNYLLTKLKPKGINLYFGEAKYSPDNSVGVALLGRKKHLYKEDENGA